MDPGGGPGIPGWFIAVFIIVALVGIGSAIARARYLSSRGVSPFFVKEQVESAIVNSELLAPPAARPDRTIEERLAELDDLHGRGVITDAELAEGRSKIISDP